MTSEGICVLGVFRSGTSLVSHLLHLMGVHFGPADMLTPGDSKNPNGYWEHSLILSINQEILKYFGGCWHNPPQFPSRWQATPDLAKARKSARRVVQTQFGHRPLWGFKDPRFCLTLPFWRKILPRLKYVVCLRNPLEIIPSLMRMQSMPPEIAARLALDYTLSMLRGVAGQERVFVFYDDLLRDVEAGLEKMAGLFGRSVDSSVAREARALARDSLRHYRARREDIWTSPWLDFPSRLLHLGLQTTLHSLTKASEQDAALRIYCEAAEREKQRLSPVTYPTCGMDERPPGK